MATVIKHCLVSRISFGINKVLSYFNYKQTVLDLK